MTLLQRLWVLGLLLGCASAQGADLITVYREAARTNPQLAAAAASLQAVRERRPQAIAGLLPSIDASGAIERQRLKDLNQSAPADNVTNKLASLDLIQPLSATTAGFSSSSPTAKSRAPKPSMPPPNRN